MDLNESMEQMQATHQDFVRRVGQAIETLVSMHGDHDARLAKMDAMLANHDAMLARQDVMLAELRSLHAENHADNVEQIRMLSNIAMSHDDRLDKLEGL
jgi:hypothetical protein